MENGVAVIGSGYWGRHLVRNFASLGALRAVCEKDEGTLSSILSDYPGVRGAQALNDVLGDPRIGAVVIATPAELHGTMVRESLLAGKDVMVEKPLAMDEGEGRDLVDLAAERGRILMVGHLLWYHPHVKRLKELVDGGELGRIRYIYSNRLNLGKIRREENILWSFAPHDISVILGLVGEMPDEIHAQGGNYLHSRIADVTVSVLSFPSGVKAHVFVSWLHPFKEQRLVVVGDRKMAVFDDVAPWDRKLLLYPHRIEWQANVPVASREQGERVEVAEEEPLARECRHFLRCIEERRTPRTDGEEGHRVLRVLNWCQESMAAGRSLTDLAAAKARRGGAVHETAVIDDDVTIGEGARIWHFSHILPGSTIGPGTIVGQNVMVGPRVSVGRGCKIQNNVSLYEGVTLEDEVFCGPSMVFTNVVNPRAHIERKKEFRSTLVKKRATIGANATILCGLTVGRAAMVGAGAVVTRDVPDFALVVGNPAAQIGWVCSCGVTLPLQPGASGQVSCPRCDRRYSGEGSVLREEERT